MALELDMIDMAPDGASAVLGPADAVESPAAIAAAGVVHDLGNLIQIASSAISLVSHRPEMPAPCRDPILARAATSLDHAGALVRQTLRMMSGRSRTVTEVSLAACLFEVKSLVDGLGEPELELDVWIEVNLPKVRCDPIGLQNAILNLIFNARDAMAGKGVIAIRAGRLVEGPRQAAVELRIADSGVGMSQETIARAFEPFFTTKDEGMGGVGLPMVERFVRESGGAISIESRPGVGTVVAVRLPGIVAADEE